MKPVSEVYLTMDEAGELLRYAEPHRKTLARRFCRRHGLPLSWRGNAALIRRDVLERFLDTGDTGVRTRAKLHQVRAS